MDLWNLIDGLATDIAELQQVQDVFIEDFGQLFLGGMLTETNSKRYSMLLFVGNAMKNSLDDLVVRVEHLLAEL